MQDLHSGMRDLSFPWWQSAASLQLWHVGLVALRHVGAQFPDQGSNLRLSLKGGFLTNGPPGKSLFSYVSSINPYTGLKRVLPQIFVHLESQNATLFGNRAFMM